MAEAAFLEPRRIRPGAAAIVVLLHGTAITALLMAKGYVPTPPVFTDTDVITVPIEPPPPPEPQRPRPREERTVWTPTPTPPFRTPDTPTVPDVPRTPPDLGSLAGSEDVAGVPEPPRPIPSPPPAPPVRREAVMISGDLQPPYPTSEQRNRREGTVVIRVVVGPDGRVVRAEKVSATSDAFYETTARHARSRWRFRPATVDGRPVEATKTLTVRFQLRDG
ncbi:MAG TPA: energy transducer TonB [Allosphingosinicella sp.]|jgi:protein TonB